MSERVILLHGLWMRAAALAPLARRLRAAGFAPETFDYHSLRGGPDAAVARLRAQIESSDSAPVHVVGHSLGGLVALECARQLAAARLGRIVCLGSPLRGSVAATSMARHWGTSWMLGDSAPLLQRGVDDWCGACDVGVIAGRYPVGLGVLLGALSQPHDGTVAVAETQLPGVRAHCVVATSHTGLLFAESAARQAIRFLSDGRFDA